jgi:hypothetical protein
MARHRNVTFNLPEKIESWDLAQYAVLLDIRDELKDLNSKQDRTNKMLECPNVRKGLEAAQRIDKRLAKKIPLR